MWQRFVSVFDDAESAFIALIVAIGGVLISVALLFHWFAVGRYYVAICFVLMLSMAVVVCIRDYRQGRWSVLSYVLLAVWMIVTAVILLFSAIVVHE